MSKAKDHKPSGINPKRKGEPVALMTPDFLGEQKEQLRQLLPHVFTEGKIDVEKLRAALGETADERPERYAFTWAGKRQSILELQKPTWGTLIPAKGESVNFDTTQNIFIEGENLEVLKLLYKAYFGRVKMIYIDPPYNTGGDFVYPDNFADPKDAYLRVSGQKDDDGNLRTSNPESSGRYHSAWLSMMYPRLFLARQLLRDDGVIFVSIDDHEIFNLRLLMNEIFGEENFLIQLIWHRRQMADSRNQDRASTDHEYVVVFKRGAAKLRGIDVDTEKYQNPDNDPRGEWFSADLTGLANKEQRPNLHYDVTNPETGMVYPPSPTRGWGCGQEKMAWYIANKRILWPSKPDGRPRLKKFLSEVKNFQTGFSSMLDVGHTTEGTRTIQELFGEKIFPFAKPVSLIAELIRQATEADGNDIVFDFFAGSATTAQAVMEQNAKDGGNRRFVLVQLPEPTGRKDFPTIADLSLERIRRVSKSLDSTEKKQDLLKGAQSQDTGCVAFKLVMSNFKKWIQEENATPEKLAQAMELFNDPLANGWKPENVIYEVAVKEGFSLALRVEKISAVKGNKIFQVTDAEKGQSFRICLDDDLKAATVKELNLKKDELFICRDMAIDDKTAANLALQCRLKTI